MLLVTDPLISSWRSLMQCTPRALGLHPFLASGACLAGHHMGQARSARKSMPSKAVSTGDSWEIMHEELSFHGPWVDNLRCVLHIPPKVSSRTEPQLSTAVSGHHMENMWVDVNGVHMWGYGTWGCVRFMGKCTMCVWEVCD